MPNQVTKATTPQYIMTLDEGTTSLRTLIIDQNGQIVASSQKEFTQIFPQSGGVEHDASEIWGTQLATIRSAKTAAHIKSNDLIALSITNQRETVVLGDASTGLPIYNAIVGQDTRTSAQCEALRNAGHEAMIQAKTGLLINPYFSGTKIQGILANVPQAAKVLKANNLRAGTIDSGLIGNLTGGKVHATDVSNASRTMLFNIHTMQGDAEILKLLNIPASILPEVKASNANFGLVAPSVFSQRATGEVPIHAVLGDQQAALFGQLCGKRGDIKSTYGTGNFTLLNTGHQVIKSEHRLLSTVAWQLSGQAPVYALEGSVFIAGAALQWLRDGLRLIYDARESDVLANLVPDAEDQQIVFVPALAGLGAPYGDTSARGAIFGLERGTRREHLVKATLEAIAFQTNDLISTMRDELGSAINSVKVDGGAANSNVLMQFQASITNVEISRPRSIETTALGVAYMAGLATQFGKASELSAVNPIAATFKPALAEPVIAAKLTLGKEAVARSRNGIK